MKRTPKEWCIRIIILFAGLVIAHLGVSFFLLADLGSDPFNVLVQGLFRSLQSATGLAFLTHGRVHIGVCFLIIVVLLFVDRSYIKIGTVICMVFGGPIIDFFTAILSPSLSAVTALPAKVLMLSAGCVILAYGMTIVIRSDAGTGPNDLVAVVLSDKLHKPFGIVRVIVDVCFVVAGFLLGGKFGAGTIICAVLVGPVADFFLPLNGRLIDRVIKGLCG